MGAILNTLPLRELDNLSQLTSDRADWLTSYADATGLAVVEVERLWHRFNQLTGSDTQTRLYPENATFTSELSNDTFVRNLIKHFPRSNTDGDSIPFAYFLLVMQWLDGADMRAKLTAIYLYLNNGEPISAPMIAKLLKHVYPETREDEIKELSLRSIRELGVNEYDHLNQEQFIAGVQRCFSPDELEQLLHFEIIPSKIIDEVNNVSSTGASLANVRSSSGSAKSHEIITDQQLRQIANQAAKRNWERLGLALGFLEYDIESYKIRHDADSGTAIYDLLRTWREQESLPTKKTRLRQCLKESGFDDLLPILN